MTEQAIIDMLSRDRSAGTERFRDELLVRCLAVIAASSRDLSDDEVELLAAAGDLSALSEGGSR